MKDKKNYENILWARLAKKNLFTLIQKSWHHITPINESTEWVVVECDDVFN